MSCILESLAGLAMLGIGGGIAVAASVIAAGLLSRRR